MAGVLNFTLGLATTSFIRNAGAAAGALAPLLSLGAAITRVGREISEGGRLFDLGRRLREQPAALARIEFGLGQIGEESRSAALLINLVNKSLGGVNEQGEDTKSVFAQIGLSISELKKLGGDEKLLKIGEALSKFDQETATNLAAKIAGRGGATSLLAIANSAEDFRDALRDAAPYAEVIGRNAAKFDAIGDKLNVIGLQIKTVFAEVAERAANIGLVLAQGFKEGRIGEFLTLSLNVAFEQSVNHFSRLMQAVFASLPDLIEASKGGGMSLMAKGNAFFADIAAGQIMGGVEGMNPSSPEWQEAFQRATAFQDIAAGYRNAGVKMREEAMGKVRDAFNAAMNAQTVDIFQSDSGARLKELFNALLSRVVLPVRPPPGDGGFLGGKSSQIKEAATNANTLERIGAIFNFGNVRGSSSIADSARNTANNTAQTTKELRELRRWMESRHFAVEGERNQ